MDAVNNHRILLLTVSHQVIELILLRIFVQKHRRDRVLHPRADRDLSVDRPDLEADKASMKLLKEQRKQAEKDGREKRFRDHEDRELGHDRKLSKKSEGFAYPSATIEDYSSMKRK